MVSSLCIITSIELQARMSEFPVEVLVDGVEFGVAGLKTFEPVGDVVERRWLNVRHGRIPFRWRAELFAPPGWLLFVFRVEAENDFSVERHHVALDVEALAVLVRPGRTDAGEETF